MTDAHGRTADHRVGCRNAVLVRRPGSTRGQLFANDELAHQAEVGLRAQPDFRDGMSEGVVAVKTVGRVVYTGIGTPLDPSRIEEAMQVVGKIALPPPLSDTSPKANPAEGPLEQLRKLGELHDSGVVSDEEFEAKKTELLGRI